MKISIIGSGYVGLVTGACLAELGNQVTCLDKNLKKISQLTNGEIPFYEPQLQELVKNNIASKNLSFTSQFADACKNKVIFVCVDTPDNEGKPDLKNFNSCIKSILKHGKTNTLIVTKSTIPLGTNSKVEAKLRSHNRINNTNCYYIIHLNHYFLICFVSLPLPSVQEYLEKIPILKIII